MVAIRTDKDRPADPGALDRVGQRILGEFDDVRNRRQTLDDLMLKDHYQYKSEYSPAEKAAIKGAREDACKLYLGLTRTKVRTLDARINEMAFGSSKKNWAIDPTPVPSVGPDTLAEAEQMAAQDPEAARMSPDERIRMAARARAERMEREMEDHLVEADYYRLFRTVTHDGHQKRAGILKGPLLTRQMRRSWGQVMVAGSDGQTFSEWKMNAKQVVTPYFEVASPWDIYLEWSSRKPNDSEWIFQRHLFGRTRIASLAANNTFFREEIQRWITLNPEGDSQWENWETQLYHNAKTGGSMPALRRKWEAIEGWGPLTAEELLQLGMESRLAAMGIKLDEVSAALLEAHPWFDRHGRLIGLALNPNEDNSRPYSFYLPMPDDDTVYGTSFPESIRDLQEGINGAFRMGFDNAATSVGPQIEVRVGRLLTQGDLKRMTPYRIWATREEPWNSANPAIQFTDFPNHTAVFLSLVNALQVLIDEVGGVPRYQHGTGGGGVGRTASGLAMLMGAAGQLVKDQLRAWDEFQEEVLRKLFNWEMQFNPNADIKGDFRIKVTTTTSILQKAEQAEQIRAFRLSTANPLDAPFTKRREMLEEEARALDLDPSRVVKTKEDMEAEMEQLAAQQAEELALQQQAEEQQGMPGAGPEGLTGQPPPPAPGAATGIPSAPADVPRMAAGGVVNETLGDVVARIPAEAYASGGRIEQRRGAPQPSYPSTLEADVAGIEHDYDNLLRGN